MNATAKDVKDFLDSVAGLTKGVNLFCYEWDDKTDVQILVLDSSGVDSDQPLVFEQPMFQILSRGAKDAIAGDAWDLIEVAHQGLLNAGDVIINSTGYLSFEPQGGVGNLGRDNKSRYVYSRNYFTYRNAQ